MRHSTHICKDKYEKCSGNIAETRFKKLASNVHVRAFLAANVPVRTRPSVVHSGGTSMRKVAGFFIALILSLACANSSLGQQQLEDNLLPVLVNGKWGFIDRAGKLIVKPKFDHYEYLEEGLRAIEVEGKWGYADGAGVIKIAPQFTEARDFSEGLAAVKVGKKWGFIDKTG